MHFSLDVRPARNGDCLIVHFGSTRAKHLVVIDGGPSGVYGRYLLPRLKAIHKKHGVDEQDPLSVDVLMVSHVDDDHIKGILDLTNDQRGHTPDLRLKVGSLWHNSFDDLLGGRPKELDAEAGFGTASTGGGERDAGSVLASFGADGLADKVEVKNEDQFQTCQVLASIPQGRLLRLDAEALGWKLNREVRGELILAGDDRKPVTLKGHLTLTVAGPMRPELLALQEAYDKWIREQKKKKKALAEAALAAFTDRSVANLSSIVLVAEFKGKRMLLTGDARGDKILEGLEMVGLLEKGGKMQVDILKVPHHGSANNMETSFFKRITADHYVFSGDGQHGNPDRETLQMLFDARGTKDCTLHFTYPIAEIDEARKEEWDKQRKKGSKGRKPAKEGWSDEKHGLTALFNQNGLQEGVHYHVASDQGHVIDLLKPIAF